MITPLFTIGVILAVLGSVIVITSVILAIKQENPVWIAGVMIGALMFIIPSVAMLTSVPYKHDVLEGNAHFVKEINVYDNDTIVTYRIDFNKPTSQQ